MNSYFNGGYNPYPMNNQPMQNSFVNQMQQASPIVWVQGLEQAKTLQMPYNSKMGLSVDKDENILYITSLDEMGRPTTNRYSFAPYIEQEPTEPVSREEFDELKSMVEKMSPAKAIKGDVSNG